jgi:hypothetical protein
VRHEKSTRGARNARSAGKPAPTRGKPATTILLFGLCKPGLIIATVSYVVLALAALHAIIFPHSAIGKTAAFVAYCSLAGLFTLKVSRVLGSKRRGRPVIEASVIEVRSEPPRADGDSAARQPGS